MSNNFEDFCNAHMPEHRICGVAYTLNNTQPVLCTHIGDQPLFYIDEEEIEEEECDFDYAELGLLADEIKTLKEEIAGYENASAYVSEKTMNRYKAFAENVESLNEDWFMNENQKDERLAQVREVLGQSRLVTAYLNVAEKHDIKIMMSAQIETAFYDRRSGTILIQSDLDIEDQVLLAVRELRRHWQHRQGALINPLLFQPEHAILVNRAQEADLAVSMIRAAWELQLAGYRDVWERVENSPMADLARAFAREAYLDFRTLNDGRAAASAFESWFLSERCRVQDKAVIQVMLSDHQGYVFENVGTSESVTVELISALGSMPFGKNYLAAHAYTILEDPIFIDVRDRSSANFLWFIKFERSCKETEQELQLDSDLSTHDIRHELLNEKSQGHDNETSQSADILQLFEYQSNQEQKSEGRALSGNGNGAQIIDLKHWSNQKSAQ